MYAMETHDRYCVPFTAEDNDSTSADCYTIERGDTVASIAANYGISVEVLVSLVVLRIVQPL